MKLAIERLQRVFRLPPRERLILVQAWGLFLLAEVGLRALPFKHLLTLSRKVCVKRLGEPALARPPSVPRLVWLVDVAGRYAPVNVTCLNRALVLSWLLGRRGIAATFRIGVARDEGGRVHAHAWVDCDGQVILGNEESERYEPLLQA